MGSFNYKFADLVDIPALEKTLADLYEAARIPSAIIDLEGNFLTGAGWQRICLDFHRKNPEAEKACIASDTHIRDELQAGEPYAIYECPHGLVDSCCPVIVDGHHLANVFTGQMLHTPLDDKIRDRFRSQAKKFDFNEEEYLKALSEVPVFPIEKHKSILEFISNFAGQIAQMGLTKLETLEKSKIIQENEEKLRAIIDNSTMAICLKDNDHKYLLINRQYAKLAQTTEREIIGKDDYDVLPKDTADLFHGMEEEVLEQKRALEFQETITLADGEHTFFTSKFPLYDPDGKIYAVGGVCTDITQRLHVEEALGKANEEWEKTFDAMSDIITIQDKDMKIIRTNKAAHDFFEVKPGALNGKYCYEIFRGDGQPCAQCPELETIADCRAHSGIITHEKLGKTFHVSSSPVFEKNGKIKYIVHVAKDITEQKKLEEELFQSHKMEAVGTLAGGIAHDFNNILSAIIGYSELTMLELPEDNPIRNNIDQINKAGFRAKELVKQILSFSRKDNQKLEPFVPASIIKEALKLMRASLPSTISIKTEIDLDCGKILADPTNLHQILVNLCTNALHAIENEKGEIHIKLTRQVLTSEDTSGQISVEPGAFVVLTVNDTGCGMEESTLKRIFEPYFTTKGHSRGTGMGLAVVHGIMQSYNGMIKVNSEPGEGTTFNLYFPAIENGATSNIEVKTGAQKPLPGGNERIMVVDDEEAILTLIQQFLHTLGYKVTTKSSSPEAFEEFRKNPGEFDLVLTDQTMPIMTGIDLSKELLNIKSDLPIIICTGYSSVVSEETAKEIGIKSYMKKPVKVKELALTVRQVLDNNRAEISPS